MKWDKLITREVDVCGGDWVLGVECGTSSSPQQRLRASVGALGEQLGDRELCHDTEKSEGECQVNKM